MNSLGRGRSAIGAYYQGKSAAKAKPLVRPVRRVNGQIVPQRPGEVPVEQQTFAFDDRSRLPQLIAAVKAGVKLVVAPTAKLKTAARTELTNAVTLKRLPAACLKGVTFKVGEAQDVTAADVGEVPADLLSAPGLTQTADGQTLGTTPAGSEFVTMGPLDVASPLGGDLGRAEPEYGPYRDEATTVGDDADATG